MASQVIENNPTGEQLNTFHESIRLICANLGISASEAVQHVVNQGKNIARVRLLLTIACAKDLMTNIVKNAPDQEIWDNVRDLVKVAYSLQTPRKGNTSSAVNTSEYRRDFDIVLKHELRSSLH